MENIDIVLCKIETSTRHMHNEMEALLLIKGSIELELKGEIYVLNEGDIVVMNPRDIHSILGNNNNVVILLRVDKQYLDRECSDFARTMIRCNSADPAGHDLKLFGEVKRLLTKMLLVRSEKKPGYQFEVYSLFYRLISHLYLNFRIHEEQAPRGDEEKDVIASALAYMNDNYATNITLDYMAKLSYMSSQYFSKFFKKKMGVGFVEYLTKTRLEHALSDLISSNDTILKIAMNNGFPNAKAFNHTFQKEYNETPGKFRKKYENRQSLTKSELLQDEFNLEVDNGLLEFLKYVRMHEVNDTEIAANQEHITISVDTDQGVPLSEPDKIVDIGRMKEVLKMETADLLQMVQNRLGFKYVYFEAFCAEDCFSYPLTDLFRFYEEYQAFEKIYQLGLIPFIKIDYTKIKRNLLTRMTLEEYLTHFINLMRNFPSNLGERFVSEWMFELLYSDLADHDEFLTFYIQFSKVLRRQNCDSIGLRAFTARDNPGMEIFERLFIQLSDGGFEPKFLTFHAFPDEEMPYIPSERYDQLANYHLRIHQEIKARLDTAKKADIPIYLTSWNTLSGGGQTAQTGTFFRSALILENIISFCGKFQGLTYPLNTYDLGKEKRHSDTSILGLFLYSRVKRPVYFVLEVMKRAAGKLIYHNQSVLITKNSEGEYIITVYNPHYIDPLETISPLYSNYYQKDLSLEIKGLERGTYQIKKFNYDNERASVFKHWMNTGYPDFLDRDVTEYLEAAIIPDLSVGEICIKEQLELRTDLDVNCIVLYKLKRKQ